uniref:C1q domain-containing protein n=1 Tax=Felis catus TaxID=9685 RepID=A0ABI7YAD6_FELCA
MLEWSLQLKAQRNRKDLAEPFHLQMSQLHVVSSRTTVDGGGSQHCHTSSETPPGGAELSKQPGLGSHGPQITAVFVIAVGEDCCDQKAGGGALPEISFRGPRLRQEPTLPLSRESECTPWHAQERGEASRDEKNHEKYSPRQGEDEPASRCFRCCDPGTPVFQAVPVPQINITILKGEKGDRGDRGLQGKYGKTGSAGARGHTGPKGQKGSMGAPGDRCKNHYAAFSVGRKKPLHSNDYYQTVIFDTEFVNLYGHFNMFTGKFYCYVPGIYFFTLNVHTWNQKETYLHIMKNGEEVVILFAQVSDRSIMQSQSLMLELRDQDEVWVRLFKGERENAIFSDEFDTYITFSGYLVKHALEP